jgi:hypothetical protein
MEMKEKTYAALSPYLLLRALEAQRIKHHRKPDSPNKCGVALTLAIKRKSVYWMSE